MALQIDSLEVTIQTSAESASSGIDKLANSLGKLKTATTGGLGLTRIANQLKAFSEKIGNIDFSNATTKADMFNGVLTKMATAIDSIDGEKLKQLTEAMKEISGSAMGVRAIKQVDNLKKELAKYSEQSAESAESESDSLKKSGKELKKASKETQKKKKSSAFSDFFKSIGRIAMYRAIRSAIKAITSALSRGITNIYQYGKIFGTDFTKSMDQAATSMQYMINGIAAGLAPVIQMLIPILTSAADAMANLGNSIGEAIAHMQGKTTFTKALKTFRQFQLVANGTAMSFDELNVLSSQDNFAKMFEEAAVDTERAEENMKKIKAVLAGIVGLLSVLGTVKGIQFFAETGALEMSVGQILLKSAGIGLMVAAGAGAYSTISEAIREGVLSDEGLAELGIEAVTGSAGLSLVMKNPIPLLITMAVSFGIANNKINNEEVKEKYDYTDKELLEAYQMGALSETEYMTHGFFAAIEQGKGWEYLIGQWTWEDHIGEYIKQIREQKAEEAKLNDIYNGTMNGVEGELNQYKSIYEATMNGVEGELVDYIGITGKPSVGTLNDTSIDTDYNPNDSVLTSDNSVPESYRTANRIQPLMEPLPLQYGSMNGVEGELNFIDPNDKQINLYLDGKQIYGAVTRAGAFSGAKVTNYGGVWWK